MQRSAAISKSICKSAPRVPTRGKGLNAFVVVGTGATTWAGSELGGQRGEEMPRCSPFPLRLQEKDVALARRAVTTGF